uniref:Deoxyribodipyrimidine photo-lyase n=1 Tax=uncultured organism TaxID=155900 RepID=A0A068FS73_9ZZZZ|nr:deoxyribodipyrimidine photo-lyase [uncultured organism]
MTQPAPVIVWLRDDLRLDDNPALLAAVDTGAPLVVIFCQDGAADRPLGGASRWWLHHSLAALGGELAARGAALTLLAGHAHATLCQLAQSLGAQAVFWNRRYTRAGIAQDSAIKADLKAAGIEARSFNANLLHEPWTLKTGSGGPYRVFTPFSRAARAAGMVARPVLAPLRLNGFEGRPKGLSLDDLNLAPRKPDWSAGLAARWRPGSAGGQRRLESFLQARLSRYSDARDLPGQDGTSGLSAHLRFGEISPRQVWHAALACDAPSEAVFKFHQELLWREFSYHLLYHFPDLGSANHQPKFDAFPWADSGKYPARGQLTAWQRGQTGYPIVDAGMRELWHTGIMHNRVRMIVASFLVKHLLIDWRIGEAWFWDTLVDADPASNAASWQWVAGSGADAAPYFRVFNPILQGEKFDGQGTYVRRWVPELASLPQKVLHRPWEAPGDVLGQAGVVLGKSYPPPIVDHATARQRALDAYKALPAAPQ